MRNGNRSVNQRGSLIHHLPPYPTVGRQLVAVAEEAFRLRRIGRRHGEHDLDVTLMPRHGSAVQARERRW